jgi:hypothetical protein
MTDLEFILDRVRSGDKLRFFQDYYGGQWVEVTSGWLIKRKTRIDMQSDEVLALKSALRDMRRQQAASDSDLAQQHTHRRAG